MLHYDTIRENKRDWKNQGKPVIMELQFQFQTGFNFLFQFSKGSNVREVNTLRKIYLQYG